MGRGVVKDRNNYWSGTQSFEDLVVEEKMLLGKGASLDLSGGNVAFPSTIDTGSVQAKDSSGVSIKTSDGTEVMNITDSGNISFFDTPISSWGSDWRAVEGPTTTWLMSAEPSGNESHFVNHAYIDNEGWKYKTSNEIPIKSSYVDGIFSISSAEEGQVDDPLTWLQFFTVKSGSVGINISDPSGSLDARSFSTSLGTTVASANLDASKALFMYSGHDNQAPTLFWNGDLGMAFATGYDYTTGDPQSTPTDYLLNQQTSNIGSWGHQPSHGPITAIWDGSSSTFAMFSIDSATDARGFSFTPSVGQGVHGRVIRALSLVGFRDSWGLVNAPIRNFKFYGKNEGQGSFSTNLNPTDWTLLVEGDSTSTDLTSPDVFTFTNNNTAYDHYMIHFLPSDPFAPRVVGVYSMGMYENASSSFTNLMEILPNGNVKVTNTLNATTLQEGYVDLSTKYILSTQKGADDGVCELVNGVVPSYRIPPLAVSSVEVVNSLEEMYELTTQRGDIVIVVDEITGESRTYIKLTDDVAPTDSGDWTELVPNAVVSVNGDSGPVVSIDTSQIAENTNLYYTDARVDGRIALSSINTLKDVSLPLATVTQTNPSIANKALRINGAGNGVDHTTFSLPVSNGTIGQVLTSDGTGNTAWAEPSTASTFLDLLDTPVAYELPQQDISSPSTPISANSTNLGNSGSRDGMDNSVENAIDGDLNTSWASKIPNTVDFVILDFGSEVVIDGISVLPWCRYGTVMKAKNFKLSGSTDGSSYTHFYGWATLIYNDYDPQVFLFENTTPYRYIKVDFSGNYDSSSDYLERFIAITELEFYSRTLAGAYVKVDPTSSGLIFEKGLPITTFTDLPDTPANFTSSEGNVVTVNPIGNALEFTSVYDVIRDTQTPDITSYNTTATISSHDHSVIFSNPSQDIALTLPISQTDASLNEESRFYIKNVSASHRVIVRGLSATDHPQVERLNSSDTTASSGSFVLHPKESAVFQGYNLLGNYRVVSHYRDDLTEIVTSSISQTKSAKTFVCTATSAAVIDLLDYPFWPLNVPILFKNLSTQDLTLDPHMSTQVDGSSNSIVIPFGKSVAIQRVGVSTLIIADDTREIAPTFLSLLDTPSTYSPTDLSHPSMPVTASSTSYGSPSHVIDDQGGVTTFGWKPDTDAVASDEFVVIDFGSEVIINSISVEPFFLNSRVAAKDFKVLGSTDGSNFTQFFPEDGSSYQQLVYNQSGPQVFDFTNNIAYRHIKVIFNGSWLYTEGIVGGSYGSYPTIDIRNLEFYQSLAGSYVKVNSTGNGLVFEASSSSGSSNFIALTDTPASFTDATLDLVRVNAAGTALEFVDTSTLGFAPSTHLSASNPHGLTAASIGAVTTDEFSTHLSASNPHGLTAASIGAVTTDEFSTHLQDPNNPHGITAAGIGAATSNDLTTHTGNTNNPHGTTFLKLGDSPSSFSGQAGKTVKVNSSENALEFVEDSSGVTTFTGLTDTPNRWTLGYDGVLDGSGFLWSSSDFIKATFSEQRMSHYPSFQYSGLDDWAANDDSALNVSGIGYLPTHLKIPIYLDGVYMLSNGHAFNIYVDLGEERTPYGEYIGPRTKVAKAAFIDFLPQHDDPSEAIGHTARIYGSNDPNAMNYVGLDAINSGLWESVSPSFRLTNSSTYTLDWADIGVSGWPLWPTYKSDGGIYVEFPSNTTAYRYYMLGVQYSTFIGTNVRSPDRDDPNSPHYNSSFFYFYGLELFDFVRPVDQNYLLRPNSSSDSLEFTHIDDILKSNITNIDGWFSNTAVTTASQTLDASTDRVFYFGGEAWTNTAVTINNLDLSAGESTTIIIIIRQNSSATNYGITNFSISGQTSMTFKLRNNTGNNISNTESFYTYRILCTAANEYRVYAEVHHY